MGMRIADFAYELKEGLAISFQAIRANKMRSVLTTLGIVIGIVSVTLMGTGNRRTQPVGSTTAFQKSERTCYTCRSGPGLPARIGGNTGTGRT